MRHFAAYETANALNVPVILNLHGTILVVEPRSTARELSEEDYEASFGMPMYCDNCGDELEPDEETHCHYCKMYGAAQ